MVADHGCSWLTVRCQVKVNVQTQQARAHKKDGPILTDWLIHCFDTQHSEIGWTLIIASFEPQPIRMLSSEKMKTIMAKKRRTDQEIS